VFLGQARSWTLQGRDCQRENVPKFIRSRRTRGRGLEVVPQKFFRFFIPQNFRYFLKLICLTLAVILGFIRNNIIHPFDNYYTVFNLRSRTSFFNTRMKTNFGFWSINMEISINTKTSLVFVLKLISTFISQNKKIFFMHVLKKDVLLPCA
jgi:hypothetical protein